MILDAIGRAVTRAPVVIIAAIVLISVVLGAFVTDTSFEARDEDFNPDTDVALASSRVNDYFGVGVRTVQVIARDPAGRDGDVLTRAALLKILDLEEAILEPEAGTPNITSTIEGTPTVPTGVQSIADILVFGSMTLQGADQFSDGMQGLSSALAGVNLALGGVAMNLSLMNETDPESSGSTLYLVNATLDSLVQGLLQLAQSSGLPTGGNGNGGAMGAPNLTTIRMALGSMDDDAVKATVSALYTFDVAPLQVAVGDVTATRDAVKDSSEVSTEAPIGGPLTSLLMDTSFLSLNHTFMGGLVNATELIEASLTKLYTIQTVMDGLTGFEATPLVMENVIQGLAGGLKVILSLDFDPTVASPRARASLMIVQQNGSLDQDVVLEAQYDLEDIAHRTQVGSDDVRFMVVGGEILFDKINESSMSTLGTLLGLAIIFIIVILALVYRNLTDTGLTLLALMFVITWTFGLGTLLGFTFNPLTTAVPILLVGLSVDYGIHLIMRYRYEKRDGTLNQATIATIASVGMALLLATVTTVFSFLSNILSSLEVMRQFGMLTAMGIISAFIIMNTFVPSCRLLIDRRRERLGKRKGSASGSKQGGPRRTAFLVRLMELGAHGAARHGTIIVVISLVISGISFLSLTSIDSEFDFMDFLPEDMEETQTITFLIDNFNFSTSSCTILLEGDVATASVMAEMERTQAAMANDRDVVKARGLADVQSPLTVVQKYGLPTSPQYIPELGEAMSASDTDADGVPDTGVATLLVTMATHPSSAGEMSSVLHSRGNGTFDAAVIRIRVLDPKDGGELLTEQLEDDMAPLEKLESQGELDGAIVTDGPVLTYNVVSEMNRGGLNSVLATIVLSAILLTVVFYITFRTVVVGLLTTIPIVLVIGWMFGSMFVLGIPLNVVTITIAALTVGLGITYAIHISHRFLEDVQKAPWKEAMCKTVGHTGAALFGAAATTIGGFGILAFSILPPLAQFGIVTALSIFYSFMASVYVLPSFLAIWARRRLGEDGGHMCATPEVPSGDTEAPGAEEAGPVETSQASEGPDGGLGGS